MEPENGSVPAAIPLTYCVEGMPWLWIKYSKKSKRSALKEVCSVRATKLKTVQEVFGPLKRSQVVPAISTVATGLPVLLIGPAPPRAASQIMISYAPEPPGELLVKISYDTSATIFEPV